MQTVGNNWMIITKPTHIFPLNDWRDHEIEGKPCWCHPKIEDNLIIHNSMDKREFYEREDILKH